MYKLVKKYYILIGFIAAFAIRTGFSLTTDIMAFPDSTVYNDAAIQILNFTYPKIGFFRPPGYPFFLATLYKIGTQNYLLVKIIQALMSTFTCYFIMKIAQKMFDRKTGYMAFVLAAINPFFIYWSGFLLSETLFTFLLIIAMFALVLFDRTNLKRYLALSAFLLASSALTRPIAVLFLPFLFIYLFLRVKKDYFSRIKDVAIFAICFVCIIMPWTVRNYLVYKEFILINNYAGLSVLGANNEFLVKIFDAKTKEEYEYYHKKFYDYIARSVKDEKSLTNSELQQKLFKLGFSYIKDNPKEWLSLRWKNFFEVWRPSVKRILFPTHIFLASFLYLFPIMLLGVLEFIRQFFVKDAKAADLLLVFIVILVGTSHFMLGGIEIRYRIPIIDPFLIIFAAHLLCLFYRRVKIKMDVIK